MVTYVLDSSALLRYLHGEPGGQRVEQIISAHLAGDCDLVISAIHWGEVAGVTCKNQGLTAVELVLARLSSLGFQIIDASAQRAVRASLIKIKGNIPYADAFGVELASASPQHVLVTADFDLKTAARDVKIEFLPRK